MTELTDHEIHEVITDVSLSTETSPTTESIAPLYLEINSGKCEHLCQIKDFEPEWIGSTMRNSTNKSMIISLYVDEFSGACRCVESLRAQ